MKSGRAIAQGLGTVLFIIFASYGLGMWFGAKEIGKCRGRKEGREGRREGGKSEMRSVRVYFLKFAFYSMLRY